MVQNYPPNNYKCEISDDITLIDFITRVLINLYLKSIKISLNSFNLTREFKILSY
jgi:hypothetical protein